MEEYDVKRLALVYSKQAKIEAMKTRNEKDLREDSTPAYNEMDFLEVSSELESLAYKKNNEL